MARPMGEIALVLRSAAAHPGTVRQLAERAQVGYHHARYTASRLVDRGELVVLDGNARPAVLVVAESGQQDAPRGAGVHEALAMLHAGFWGVAAPAHAVEDEDPGGI